MEVEVPEVDRPSRVHRITKRPCLHRTAKVRFRRRLRSRRIPRLRLNLCCLCRARAQAPILRALPEHRPPPKKSPPYRRLESLTCDNPLPRDLRLPWLSRRAGKAVLSAGRSHIAVPRLRIARWCRASKSWWPIRWSNNSNRMARFKLQATTRRTPPWVERYLASTGLPARSVRGNVLATTEFNLALTVNSRSLHETANRWPVRTK
jgi:hypothetical protein